MPTMLTTKIATAGRLDTRGQTIKQTIHNRRGCERVTCRQDEFGGASLKVKRKRGVQVALMVLNIDSIRKEIP